MGTRSVVAPNPAPTIAVGPAHDPLEREAEQRAAEIARGRSPAIRPLTADRGSPALRRACAKCEDEEHTLQRDALAPAPNVAPAPVMAVLGGPGSLLAAGVRAFMEPRFGADFSRVRVHADRPAAESADAVGARAYTVGHDIVFAAGAYSPETTEGRELIAHELTHVLQQRSGMRRLQRAVTRGAGGCAAPDALDEDDDGPRGAGRLAHNQIQTFLLPRIINEVEIPRATKRQISSTGCQIESVEAGRADLYLRGGSSHEIAEIKPIRHDMSHAVNEADHYIRRAGQSLDRFFSAGALCPGATAGADDTAFARRIGVSRLNPSFARMTGILTDTTVIGPFDGDPARTLKAKLHSPGAVGYWCTGGRSDTFTCGVSDAEMQQYIDRVALAPAQALLDAFLRDTIERRLEQAFAARSLGEILALGERHFGASIRAQLRPYLGPLADQIISRASAEEIGRLVEESIGPEARAIVTTLVRRMTSMIVAELRVMLRGALAGMIRSALLALCVGVPAVALSELLDRLRQSLRDTARVLIPVAVAAVAARLAQAVLTELGALLADLVAAIGRALGAIGEALLFVGEILLRVLAVIVLLLLAVAVVVFAVGTVLSALDPVPGDEVALGIGTAFLAGLMPAVFTFILTGSTEETPDGA
jgi:hypothetical protein